VQLLSAPVSYLIRRYLHPFGRHHTRKQIEIHAVELMVNWNLASKGRTINSLDPLK
jgi:hypothetical protein